MNRKLFVVVSILIMTLLAVIIARVLREPFSLNDASMASLSPQTTEGLIVPDSENLPVTAVTPGEDREHSVAALSADRAPGQDAVTAPPTPSGPPVPRREHEDTREASPPAGTPAPGASAVQPPAPATPGETVPVTPPSPLETPVVQAPVHTEAPAQAPEASGQAAPPPAGQAAGQTPEQTPAQNSDQTARTSAQTTPARPGTIVTRASLPARAGQSVVTQATMSMDGDNVILRLEANTPIKADAFLLTGPDRVVMDIRGQWQVEPPRVLSNRMVNALRAGNQENATRLVFDMRVKPQRASVSQIGDNIIELRIR